jgi:hypothetical protein
VDNYAHGLIISEKALYAASPALGKFYIVTDGDSHPGEDGPYAYFWKTFDEVVVGMENENFESLWDKFKLPLWFLMTVAYICNVIGFVLRTRLKLNPFNVTGRWRGSALVVHCSCRSLLLSLSLPLSLSLLLSFIALVVHCSCRSLLLSLSLPL